MLLNLPQPRNDSLGQHPALKATASMAKGQFRGFLTKTLVDLIDLGREMNKLSQQFSAELEDATDQAQRSARSDSNRDTALGNRFKRWVETEFGNSSTLAIAAMELARWWDKLCPAQQRLIKAHPLDWSLSAFKELTRAASVSTSLFRQLVKSGKQTADSIRRAIALHKQFAVGKEVLVLNDDNINNNYQGQIGIIEQEPDEAGQSWVRMADGALAAFFMENLLPVTEIMTEADWDKLLITHDISVGDVETLKDQTSLLASEQAIPGHHVVVTKQHLQAVLYEFRIRPKSRSRKCASTSKSSEDLYTAAQVEEKIQQAVRDAIAQHDRERQEDYIRMTTEVREEALRQAGAEVEAKLAYNARLAQEKEELLQAIAMRDAQLLDILEQQKLLNREVAELRAKQAFRDESEEVVNQPQPATEASDESGQSVEDPGTQIVKKVETVASQFGSIVEAIGLPGWSSRGYRSSADGVRYSGLAAFQAFVRDVKHQKVELQMAF